MKRLFLDSETQGTNSEKNGIWQVSGCVDIDGKPLQHFNTILNPPEKYTWEERARDMYLEQKKIHGYDIERDGQTYQSFHQCFTKEILSGVDKFNKNDKFFLIGYHVTFDDRFLRALFADCGDQYYGSFFAWPAIDVAVLAAHHLGEERLRMTNFKLGTVAQRFGIQLDESKLHDAAYDIEMTREIYLRLNGKKAI